MIMTAMSPAAARPVAMPPKSGDDMPKKPYQYAAFKHDMTRKVELVGIRLKQWRIENCVSKSDLVFVANEIAKALKLPVKLTYADINGYEEGRWVKAHYEYILKPNHVRRTRVWVPGHYDPKGRCQPKIDKLFLLCLATGMTDESLVGYNPFNVDGHLTVDIASFWKQRKAS